MSRIGKKPIPVPKGVQINLRDGLVEVKGPKGQLSQLLPPGVTMALEDGQIVTSVGEAREQRKFHGLGRTLVANAVQGVSEGFKHELDIVGVGYRAEVKGRDVHFALGYSHPVVFPLPQGIDVAIEKQTHVTVTGIDKQLVGQVAAENRGYRPPEPYTGKGVRYEGEYVRRKEGKKK